MAFLLKGSEVTKAMKDKMIIEVEELSNFSFMFSAVFI
jgi:hypothetical protein